MSTFTIERNIDDYQTQLKTMPMQELRHIMTIQTYNDKRWKLQSEFRRKVDSLLNCGKEICFLWKDEKTDAVLNTTKNIEIIFFSINILLSNITNDFNLDSKIKIIYDFYCCTEIKQRLLLIQNQCLDLFQSVTHLQGILTSKAEEISKQQKNNKLLTNLEKKFVIDPMNSTEIVNISNILNQLYGDISAIPQDQLDLIDKYLALSNFIISVNLIYQFDFIAENERIEKEERIAIVDKERRRVSSLPNPLSKYEKEINELKTKNQKLEKELETQAEEHKNELIRREKLYSSKLQEHKEQYQELNLSIIPLMPQKI